MKKSAANQQAETQKPMLNTAGLTSEERLARINAKRASSQDPPDTNSRKGGMDSRPGGGKGRERHRICIANNKGTAIAAL
eukprot:2309198-Rhodomonas_salina.1